MLSITLISVAIVFFLVRCQDVPSESQQESKLLSSHPYYAILDL